MSKLEIVKQKAKLILKPELFEQIDNYINSIPAPGTKKASVWEDFLAGKMILNKWVEPTNLSTEEIKKIDDDIKNRGSDAILDIIDEQMMLPKNLKEHLRKKYTKELSEVKEIIHNKKYSIK